jgi:hypothetical protein
MSHFIRIALSCAILISVVFDSDIPAFASPPLSSRLQPLDKAVGSWISRGTQLKTPYTKAGMWTWHVDCGWSANRIYFICSFIMQWPEGPDHSLSISTYNSLDKAYWHYEVLDDQRGSKPVVSRMTVQGNTWTLLSENANINGKTSPSLRVVYRFESPSDVDVVFEMSSGSGHWIKLGSGIGIKQS